MQHPSRASACRRELKNHDAAEPRDPDCLQERGQEEDQGTLLKQSSEGGPSEAAGRNYMEPPCHIEPPHCVGSPGIQSVRGAAAASTAACSLGWLRRRLEYAARHGRQRGAGDTWCVPRGKTGPWRAHHQPTSGAALPNPSLKRSVNGGPPGPGCGALHSPQPGPGVPPSPPA